MACLRLCNLAQEALSFRRPPTSRLASQNHKSGSPVATSQFRVNSFLASLGTHQSSPIDIDAARLGVCHLFSMARPLSCPRQVGLHGITEARRRRLPDEDHPHALEGTKSRSRTMTFVVTRAPASRQTRAAALSNAKARRPNTPAPPQAARWWPRGSRRRPHRQKREEGGRGCQRRRNKSTRNTEESNRACGDVVKQVNGMPARGPAIGREPSLRQTTTATLHWWCGDHEQVQWRPSASHGGVDLVP